MRFVIHQYQGALPVKFGMSKEELVAMLPEIALKDIPTFGNSSKVIPENYRRELSSDNNRICSIAPL
jgi:hypothetical protein